MSEIVYKIDMPENFSEDETRIFRDLLAQQGKVTNPSLERINRCKILGVCKVDKETCSNYILVS